MARFSPMGFDMNKLALGILVAVGFSATAQAADIDVSPRPVAPMVMIYNWSGFYVGAHGGGAWGKSNWLNTASSAPLGLYPDLVPGDPNGHNISGWLAGGQMGYNFQSGALVYGLELSGSAADLKGSSISQAGPFSLQDDVFATKITSFFLASARLGYAADNFLLYVKGGYAGAHVKTSAVDVGPPSTGSGYDQRWHHGWNVGAGVEFGFTPNWSLALQYDYIQLETVNDTLGGTNYLNGVAGAKAIYNWDVNPRNINAATVRLNYRFGGPAVARY
jgi:outer membrane immunogenic protein